tara:strand:+ start:118 stop:279 length:162 start_codon:yes stop_codon:yes gene_type:complete
VGFVIFDWIELFDLVFLGIVFEILVVFMNLDFWISAWIELFDFEISVGFGIFG